MIDVDSAAYQTISVKNLYWRCLFCNFECGVEQQSSLPIVKMTFARVIFILKVVVQAAGVLQQLDCGHED